MINVRNSTVTSERRISHMKKIKSVLRPSMAQERMYNLALLNTEQDIVHKIDYTVVIDLFTAAKNRKNCFKCFISKDLQFWISFSSISGPKILLLSVPDPWTPAAGGETFVRTHPRAYPPNAAAHPLLLGWLRPCRCDLTAD